MLTRLPTELIQLIIDELPREADRASLAQVSKRLYCITIPRLLQRLTLKAKSEDTLHQLEIPNFQKTWFNDDGSLSKVNRNSFLKDIVFTAPFIEMLDERCLGVDIRPPKMRDFDSDDDLDSHPAYDPDNGSDDYSDDYFDDDGDDDSEHDSNDGSDSDSDSDDMESWVEVNHRKLMRLLSVKLSRFVLSLPKNTLRSFSWHLGVCIPVDALSRNGCLSTQRKSLEKLSIINSNCPRTWSDVKRIPQFRNLRHLSWVGYSPLRNKGHLVQLLQHNFRNLETLHLQSARIFHFIPKVLQKLRAAIDVSLSSSLSPRPIRFSSLRTLSLANVPLDSCYDEMVSVLCLGQLRSLKLQRCPHTPLFLHTVTNAQATISLKSFEVSLCEPDMSLPDSIDSYTDSPISQFLQSFTGLQELYILVDSETDRVGFEAFGNAIAHHSETLRRTVIHLRDRRKDRPSWCCNIDEGNQASMRIDEALAQSNVEAVGLCLPQQYIKSIPGLVSHDQQFKLLHMRHSGYEISGRQFRSRLYKWLQGTGSTCPWQPADERHRELALCHTNREALSGSQDSGNNNYGGGDDDEWVTDTSDDDDSRADWYPQRLWSFETNLLDFAQWAFGPQGFPKLLILAFGDFSHNGRYLDTQVLFCRNPSDVRDEGTGRYFRIMSKEDAYLWGRIEGGYDMLSVCPVDDLIDLYDS